MAITTLPYPSMDFTPLDVLTADELDQIVANIEAINSASIGTSAIANSAITTLKVDDGAITTAKINDGAITNVKIADGVIGNIKLDWADFTTGTPTKVSSSIANLSAYNYYIKYGRLVLAFINIQATSNISSGTNLISGFPIPVNRACFGLGGANDRGIRARIMDTGVFQTEDTLTAGYYNGNCAYWSAS